MSPTQVSTVQLRILEALQRDLDGQLASNWAMPAVLAADKDGQLSAKTLMPLDPRIRAISDAHMTQLILRALEADGVVPAVLAWVRVDVDPPEIISLDLESGAVCTTTPRPKADRTLDWQSEMSESLDQAARGGSDADKGVALMRQGGKEKLEANAALEHIADDAIERLAREVAGGGVVSTEDVSEQMMLDFGADWGHGEVPPALATSGSLGDRLRQLRDHARTFDRSTTLHRFRHEGSIYLFALYVAGELESGSLLETRVVGPGELAEPEYVGGEELSRLLGLAEDDE